MEEVILRCPISFHQLKIGAQRSRLATKEKKFLCRRGSFYSHPKLNKLTLIQSVLKNQQRGLSKLVDLHRANGLDFDKPKFLLLLFGGEQKIRIQVKEQWMTTEFSLSYQIRGSKFPRRMSFSHKCWRRLSHYIARCNDSLSNDLPWAQEPMDRERAW